ncbi:MAG: tyrosine--tRNA ligase, partial [Candidatus Puniceispirillales bacterium]
LPLGLIDALKICGFAASNGEARRLIRGGGARINDISISDEDHQITPEATNPDGEIKISAGKKRHAILQTAS